MFCLAGIGGGVDPIMDTTAAADRILAIDGCPLDCVRHTLERAGFEEFHHVRVTDLGLKKGETAVSEAAIDQVVARASTLLSA
jgi:uncharacterized metal-binding protein